jgi:hypothetical protein
MMIARWSIDARFGQKQVVLNSLKKWCVEIGAQIGWTADKIRILSGSIGAPESTLVTEVKIENLVDLNAAWEKLGTIEAHKHWSKELEPYVVSGTHRWEVFRVV